MVFVAIERVVDIPHSQGPTSLALSLENMYNLHRAILVVVMLFAMIIILALQSFQIGTLLYHSALVYLTLVEYLLYSSSRFNATPIGPFAKGTLLDRPWQ